MKVTIIGCGNMGLMFARAVVKNKFVLQENLLLVEKSEERREELIKLAIGTVVDSTDARILDSNMFIVAVKPQGFEAMASELKPLFKNAECIISIMAGMKISKIESLLDNSNIVRAMPNSPCQLGMGMTGFTAHKDVSTETIHKAENLLATTGRAVFFENEDLIDACTAVSGSGPAYFFYIIQNMIEAGMKLGLDESASSMLAKQTMLGSYHIMNSSSNTLDELIKAVASKGGTTQAALDTFDALNVGEGIQKGMESARDRARELSK
jgi:pyrroline-5-carboxylate reductase